MLMSVLASIFLSSCNNNKDQSGESFNFEDFETVQLSLQRELLTDNPDIIGKPVDIEAINDSIVAICRMDGNRLVVLYNLNSGTAQTAVRQGGGPLEMLMVWGMSVDGDGELWLSGTMDKKIMTTRWSGNGGDDAITEMKIKSPVNLMRGVTDGKGGMIAMPATSDNIRLIMFDNTGSRTDSLMTFPEAELPDSVKPNNYIFQAVIDYSRLADKTVIANRAWNEIAIYDNKNHEIRSLISPLAKDVVFEKISRGEGFSCTPKPFWHLYSGVSAGKDSFVAGFVGVKIESDSDYDKFCGKLLEFGWSGEPKRAFIPASEAVLFDVDFDNGYIYTIENDPDPVLVRYKM